VVERLPYRRIRLPGAGGRRDRIAVAQMAMSQGISPANMYMELAVRRGFKRNAGPSRTEMKHLQRWADTDPERFDQGWEIMKKAGLL
jgi:hypothetical protein